MQQMSDTRQRQHSEHTVERPCCLPLSRLKHAHQPISCTSTSARNPTANDPQHLVQLLYPSLNLH